MHNFPDEFLTILTYYTSTGTVESDSRQRVTPLPSGVWWCLRKGETRPLVLISALCSPQWLDTVKTSACGMFFTSMDADHEELLSSVHVCSVQEPVNVSNIKRQHHLY